MSGEKELSDTVSKTATGIATLEISMENPQKAKNKSS